VPEPYWRVDGPSLVPQPAARAPWGGHDTIHGRLLTALAARAVEREHADGDFTCARLTVDLFRAARLAPIELATAPVRQGGRVRAVDVEITSEGRTIARASALLLRRGEQPPTGAWRPGAWDAPAPDELETTVTPESEFLPIEARHVTPGGFTGPGRKRIWLRERCLLVEGEEWTPLTRAAVVADLTNALANSGEEPNTFINADVTLYLARPPEGDWVGLEVAGHVSDAGVSVASCDLHDVRGRIGSSTVGAVANPTPVSV
jgi:hypothetical protein